MTSALGSGKGLKSTCEGAKKASKLGRVSRHLQPDDPLLRGASQLPGIMTAAIAIRRKKNCQSCINRLSPCSFCDQGHGPP